jgi:hypothetical protein
VGLEPDLVPHIFILLSVVSVVQYTSTEEMMPTQEELRAAGLLDGPAAGLETDSGPDLNAQAAPSGRITD